MSINRRELPLFPINAVLFPGMTLPLRIFEPCYLELIRECMENDSTVDLPTLLHREADLLRGDVTALTVVIRGEEILAGEHTPPLFSEN